jgi:hypothetical protein
MEPEFINFFDYQAKFGDLTKEQYLAAILAEGSSAQHLMEWYADKYGALIPADANLAASKIAAAMPGKPEIFYIVNGFLAVGR